MNKTITTIIVATLLMLAMIGVQHIDKLNDGINLKTIELQDNSAKLKVLNKKYQDLNTELDKAGADKSNVEQELNKLQVERDELQRQLQARLDAKRSNIASNTQNALSGTAEVSGSCSDWMAQAGVTDIVNATWLINKESGCDPYAVNPTSGACGIAQELECGKSGCGLGNPVCQIRWMQSYVMSRYGSWSAAVSFHLRNSWY